MQSISGLMQNATRLSPQWRRLFLWLLLFLPMVVFAAEDTLPDLPDPGTEARISWDLFKVQLSDKSLQYLGRIFGPVGDLPLYGTNFLFKELFTVLSAVFITFALVIVMWTVIISLINTASQGEMMGKKWSTIWVPVRALTGMLLLLPTETGYNSMQVFVMWVILNGVGAANQVWNVVLDYYDQGIGITDSQPNLAQELQKPGQGDLIKTLFEGMVCREIINDFMQTTQIDVMIKENKTLIIGDVTTREPVCGSFTTRDFSTIASKYAMAVTDPTEINKTQLAGLLDAATLLEEDAYSVVHDNPGTWGTPNHFFEALMAYKLAIMAAQRNTQNSPTQQSRNDGWIVAGNYYFKLISSDVGESLSKINPTYTTINANSLDPLAYIPTFDKETRKILIERIQTRTKRFINKVMELHQAGKPPQRKSIGLGPTNVQGSARKGWDQSFGKVKEVGLAFIDYLTNSKDKSPMKSMAKVGSEILFTTEVILGVMLGVMAIMAIAMNWGVCFQGAGRLVYDIMQIMLPCVAAILMLLWVGGVTMAIYLPLIPFVIYTFTALSWLILVIEAMIAAPLIALGLTTPSEDELSRANPAMILLLNLGLRPTLIVLGYIAAIKLFDVAIQIINFGFKGTVESTLSGMTIFSTVALVVLYVVFILAIAEKCFSAIYTIPDKVIVWLGGQPESSDVADALQAAKGGVDSGAAVGQQLGTGAVELGGKAMDGSKKHYKKKQENKGNVGKK